MRKKRNLIYAWSLVSGIGSARYPWKWEAKAGLGPEWWVEILFISSRLLDPNSVYAVADCPYLLLVAAVAISLLSEVYKQKVWTGVVGNR